MTKSGVSVDTSAPPRVVVLDHDQEQPGFSSAVSELATDEAPKPLTPADRSSSMSIAEDVTMEDVARIMREEDAQLLELMHFEQSCSTGETPVLKPIKARLDEIEDIPLVFEAKLGEKLGDLSGARLVSSPAKGESSSPLPTPRRDSRSGGSTHHLGAAPEQPNLDAESHHDYVSQSSNPQDTESFVYRTTLSGEVKYRFESASSVGGGDIEQDEQAPEGEETTTCSTAFSPDAVSASPSSVRKVSLADPPHLESADVEEEKRRRTTDDRRMNEAVQFAQAVGEMPPMNNNELCIIEEDCADDTDDDDDDDDGNGTVIRLDDFRGESSFHNDHVSLHDNLDAMSRHSQKSEAALSRSGEPPSDIPREIIRRKSRPQWPLQLPGWTFTNLDNNVSDVQDFVYKGIHSNPPEIVKRGMSRGNHVQLHRKAWLEVSDKYHRYGKNLRLYYRHWESLGYPTNMFFDWLDSKGEAAGEPLPNLEECPRSKLDSDTVLYITNPEATLGYALRIETFEGRCRFYDVDGEIVRTGPDGWIFVLRDGIVYAAEKITSITGQSKQRFHHSSFFGGKAVAAAGIIITDDEGFMTRLYPHSGHYRPREAHMQRLLFFLYHAGVDLRTFEMDTQQIMHVARDTVDAEKAKPKSGEGKKEKKEKKEQAGGGEKKKKIDSLMLWPGVTVACYVAHKAHFIGEGVFAQIHKIRNANVSSVSEALMLVGGGGGGGACNNGCASVA